MIGWFPSSQIIIVHTGQVVVNQGHGVNHFEGHGGGHAFFEQFLLLVALRCSLIVLLLVEKHAAGRQAQNGSNALATGHERIHHGFDNHVRFRFGTRDRFFQGRFDPRQSFDKVGLEIKFRLGTVGGGRRFGVGHGSLPDSSTSGPEDGPG
jgi:hypothetical protein